MPQITRENDGHRAQVGVLMRAPISSAPIDRECKSPSTGTEGEKRDCMQGVPDRRRVDSTSYVQYSREDNGMYSTLASPLHYLAGTPTHHVRLEPMSSSILLSSILLRSGSRTYHFQLT
jgi:hypothetical protein